MSIERIINTMAIPLKRAHSLARNYYFGGFDSVKMSENYKQMTNVRNTSKRIEQRVHIHLMSPGISGTHTHTHTIQVIQRQCHVFVTHMNCDL